MLVTDTFIRGKRPDQQICEDALFVGDRFVAVIDGVTSKGHLSYDGKTSGRRASEVLAATFRRLDSSGATHEPLEIIGQLDQALAQDMGDYVRRTGKVPQRADYLRAAVIYYDCETGRVVTYGDCQCRIGDAVFTHAKRIDELLATKRVAVLRDCLAAGMTVEQLRRDDPGRAAILDDLRHQFVYENVPGALGYPMLDGHGICEEMLVVHEVPPGHPLVLCSDGYPVVCETREESERALRTILEEDPLLMRLYPSTKGWDPSNESYDDRTWVSMRMEAEPKPTS